MMQLQKQTDRKIIRDHFDQFVHAWYKLTLKEVQYHCQRPAVNRPVDRTDFARETS